jgi:hypothetical protein
MAVRTKTLLGGLLTVLVVASVVAMGSLGGATQAGTNADARADSGGVVWQGQTVLVSANESQSGETWQLREVEPDDDPGSLVTEFGLDGNGNATLSTNGLEGQYVVVNADGEPVRFENGRAVGTATVAEASWEVAVQTLNATFGTEQLTVPDNESALTDLHVSSNRDEYPVSLFADNLTAEQLAEVFPEVEVVDGQAVMRRNLRADGVLDANFSGVEPGTYEVTVVATDTAASATTEIVVSEEEPGAATFENGTVVEQRGDVAQFTVQFEDTDRATVTVGSPDVGYEITFTLVDADGDGEATVRLNTFLAGQQPGLDEETIRAVSEDEIADYEMTTDPVPGPLDAAEYDLDLTVAGQTTDAGALVLNERSTEGMAIWTAPDKVSPASADELLDVVTQTDEIAHQDWAVVQVEASGLSGYVENVSDLDDPEMGLSFELTEDPGRNVPERAVDVTPRQVVIDRETDSLFVLVDTNGLEVDSEYTATFTIDDSNPYVAEGQNESVSATFTVAERTISFENLTDGRLELPASSTATIGGTTSAAPGTEIDVQVRARGTGAFFERDQATVADDGTWNATVDLSGVNHGTEFVVQTDDPQANVTGVVVEDADAQEETPSDETETPTNETETPTNETETPAGNETATPEEDGTPANGAETPTGDEETPDEEAAQDTTTEADASSVLAAGDETGLAFGLATLLAAAVFVVLRRR